MALFLVDPRGGRLAMRFPDSASNRQLLQALEKLDLAGVVDVVERNAVDERGKSDFSAGGEFVQAMRWK
jgi:hypothetical protein